MNIVITGAATGIGLATARQAVACGHNVGLFDIDQHTLIQASSQQPFASHNHLAGALDVRMESDWHEAFALMLHKWGSVDILVNNAGILASGHLEHIGLHQQLNLIQINCNAVVMGCHIFKQYWDKQSSKAPHSKIINLSSASAIYGQPEIATYSASKFFVRGLTEALDIEWQPQGLRVLDIMPLWVQSNMTQGVHVSSMNTLGVRLTPSDVAATIFRPISTPNQRIMETHHPVGLPARMLYALSQITPAPIIRWINKKVGRK